jgi:hypothetical protein
MEERQMPIAYQKLTSIIEKLLFYLGDLDLSTPEGSQRSALRSMAATLGIDLRKTKEDELKQKLVEKALATEMEQKQAEAYISQLQEIVQFRLALGAREQFNLAEHSEIEKYLEEIKRQDQQHRAKLAKGVAKLQTKREGKFAWDRRDEANRKQEEYLREHAEDLDGGPGGRAAAAPREGTQVLIS